MRRNAGLFRLGGRNLTRIRKIAVLIDGGFFLKRLKSWPSVDRTDPAVVAEAARRLCKRHVQKLTGERANVPRSVWLDHVYRLFYYDALPFDGAPHHPLKNRQINFANTPEAKLRLGLFDAIRRKRKFALRLGHLKKDGDWVPYNRHMKGLLKLKHHADYLAGVLNGEPVDARRSTAALEALSAWQTLGDDDIQLPLRQKGVDMRIGLDISTMTLKGQVDTIILVTGDSDFIPAAKVARREGVEFILDPMWQSVEADLQEHVDGIASGFDRPGTESLLGEGDEDAA
jgi:uncharacterized LabA/DUF88 family protein